MTKKLLLTFLVCIFIAPNAKSANQCKPGIAKNTLNLCMEAQPGAACSEFENYKLWGISCQEVCNNAKTKGTPKPTQQYYCGKGQQCALSSCGQK